MGQSAPATTTNISRTEPSPEQTQLLNTILPGIQGYAATTPQRYPGSTIAPFNPVQTAGQEAALGGAVGQAALGGQGAGALSNALGQSANTPANIQTLLSAIMPGSNPSLNNAIAAATRPISENFTQNVLPAIQGQFGIDNWGNSGRGLAEGVAAGRTGQAIGDTAARLTQELYGTNANLAQNVYNRDQSTLLQALGLLPSTQQALVTPATTTAGVGDVMQGMSQAQLDELVRNFNFDQTAPFLHSQDILSIIQGLPGATNISTGTAPRPNTALQSLGGAASGAAIGSALFPGAGTAVGAGAGALLPFLLNR